MAKINKTLVGESLVGDGNEVAHIDLLIGPKGSAAESAFCNTLTNNKDGFTSFYETRRENSRITEATFWGAVYIHQYNWPWWNDARVIIPILLEFHYLLEIYQ